MVPPCASASLRAIARPRPLPPEPAVDRLKRRNFEEYSDRYHAFVKCIQGKGVDVSANGDGPLITFTKEGDNFDDRVTQITDDCRKLAEFQ
jgi:hypothetical protein